MATIYGTAAADTIFGPLWEANYIFGDADKDKLYAGKGNDKLVGGRFRGDDQCGRRANLCRYHRLAAARPGKAAQLSPKTRVKIVSTCFR